MRSNRAQRADIRRAYSCVVSKGCWAPRRCLKTCVRSSGGRLWKGNFEMLFIDVRKAAVGVKVEIFETFGDPAERRHLTRC